MRAGGFCKKFRLALAPTVKPDVWGSCGDQRSVLGRELARKLIELLKADAGKALFQAPGGVVMVTLETDRLILRMFRESDLDAYAEMCGDAEVMRYIGDGQPLPRYMAWRKMAMLI